MQTAPTLRRPFRPWPRRSDAGADFSLGSRYVPGGSTEDGWGVLRWVNSKIATVMARPFTSVRDPMSGFFCIKRSTWKAGSPLDPIGYKIGLELIVKCRCRNVVEVPIHFSTRCEGESKLTLRVQWEYLLHIIEPLSVQVSAPGEFPSIRPGGTFGHRRSTPGCWHCWTVLVLGRFI